MKVISKTHETETQSKKVFVKRMKQKTKHFLKYMKQKKQKVQNSFCKT